MSEDKYPFDPKTTVFTNLALDKIMPRVSPNAWKILCLALRKTQGWADADSPTGRKQSDVIAVSQFMAGCGIASNNTVQNAIAECLEKAYLCRVPSGQSFRYRLNLTYALSTPAETAPVEAQTTAETAQVTTAETAQVEAQTTAETAHTNSKVNSKLNSKLNTKEIEAAPQAPAPRKRKPLCAANQAHWETTKRRLNDKQLAAIEAAVTDLKLWQSCLDSWLMRGYNPGNVDSLLNVYREGGLQENRYDRNQGRGTGTKHTGDPNEF